MDTLSELKELINSPETPELDYETALENIASKVAEMLDENADLLFSYLYRLDVDERLIKHVMAGSQHVPIHIGLAKLILDRQIQRVKTQKMYTSRNTDQSSENAW